HQERFRVLDDGPWRRKAAGGHGPSRAKCSRAGSSPGCPGSLAVAFQEGVQEGLELAGDRYPLSLVALGRSRDRSSAAACRDSIVAMALTNWFAPVPLRALAPSTRISLAASLNPPSIASPRIGSSSCIRPRT